MVDLLAQIVLLNWMQSDYKSPYDMNAVSSKNGRRGRLPYGSISLKEIREGKYDRKANCFIAYEIWQKY